MSEKLDIVIYGTKKEAIQLLCLALVIEAVFIWLLLFNTPQSTFTSFGLDSEFGQIGSSGIKLLSLFGLVYFGICIPGYLSDLFRIQPALKVQHDGIWCRWRSKLQPIPWNKITDVSIKTTNGVPLFSPPNRIYIELVVDDLHQYIRQWFSKRNTIRIDASHLWAGNNLSAEALLEIIQARLSHKDQ